MTDSWIKTELGDKKYFVILGSGIQLFENEKDYLSTSSVVDDKIDHVEQRITFIKRPSRANMQPIKNSVWFAKMKETLKVLLIDEKIIKNNILSTGFCGIKCIDVSPELLKQFFMSKKFNSKKDLLSEGSTQKAINNTKTATIEISFPKSFQEQQKIADILTKLDETIEFTEKIIAKDERIKKGLMQDLFSKGIDENGNLRSEETHEFNNSGFREVNIPQEWFLGTMKKICNLKQGLQIAISKRKKAEGENCLIYITVQYLNNPTKNIEYIENPPESVICDENDILFVRTGNTGQIITDINGVFHNNFFKIIYNENKILKKYLVYFLKQIEIQNLIQDLAGTTTIPDLNHGDFYSIPMYCSKDLKEQQQIALILSSIDSKIQKEKQELNKLKSIKEGLMQDLLTGNKQKEVTCMIKEAVV
jgi:type I restriction enzyme, S subunit